MGGELAGIEEDVPFDFGVADALISACESAASLVEGQAGSRAAWVSTALRDFKGYFSGLFTDNAATAAADATELSSRLREVAQGARRLKEEAAKEQKRREVARAWKKEHDDRNMFEKGMDSLFGEDAPPVGPPATPINVPVSPPRSTPRKTPPPGSGGGGGGRTSSARPSNLRTFATGSAGANQALHGKPQVIQSALSEFAARCRWGSLSADGVPVGFGRWLTANIEDVQWATVVADAFARAGGEGAISTVANSALLATLRAHDIDPTRDDIVIDPPTAYGNPPTTGYADDPVNTATGNFLENESDLGFAGGASGLALTRTYNSFDTESGAFGPGWSSITEARLDLTDEAARMVHPDGRVITFPRLGEGWDRAVGANLWLTQAEGPDGTLVLRVADNDGSAWDHTASGVLLGFGSGPGTGVVLDREAGRLVRLRHARGREIELVWEGERVVAARTSDGREVHYAYDNGRLVGATGPLGTRSYRWNDAGLVEAVIGADGVVEVENTYDEHRRVTAQRSPHGRTTRYAYLPSRVTVVSDADGTRSNTWLHDARGRLIGVVDAHEHRQSMSYDAHGNPVLITERDGSVTIHEYDDRGRRRRTVSPSGADLSFGYDHADRLVSVASADGSAAAYLYRGESRQPDVLIDPEAGRTELTWTDGLLTALTDPTGVVVRFAYDEHGDLVATTDAEGNTARLERDHAGRVVAAISPSGARTTYSYDETTGLLRSRRDPDGATWRYEHTTAGRLRTIIDPTGARTDLEYAAHGEEERTIDPLGRAITRRLDDLGNLATVELPDGSTWRFTHDDLSRLTATTAPDGATWTREHDENGRLAATTDPTGVRQTTTVDLGTGRVRIGSGEASTTTAYDALGRLTSAEQPDGSVAMATYDRCGRPVELLDADGGLTLVRRDAAGRPVEVTAPSGATTRYDYDHCGRLATVTDPLGAVTTYEYDADRRLVRVQLPTGESVRTQYDVCGRVVARHEPGRGVARYAYDALGRVVESSDTWFGRRRFRYDAAGQLVEVVDGNGGVTRYEYDERGRVVAVTDPLGETTRRVFDAMDRCVQETDPLGRTTRAGYDAAGRQLWQEDPEGHRTEWTYDEAGMLVSMAVDGRTVTEVERDLRGRRLRVRDHLGDRPCEHELEWDRCGHLVRRARDGRAVTWEYDVDGHRTAMTTPDGSRTTYEHDLAGRLRAVEHPLLGRVTLERDAAGRLVSAVAGGLVQGWEHHDGWVVAHTAGQEENSSRTVVSRDDEGRVVRVEREGTATDYTYDQARQLVGARTGDSVTRWRYDAAGRLVTETVSGPDGTTTTEHVHDAAGQLLRTTGPAGTVEHEYDGLGRRVRTTDDRGRVRELAWGRTGWLSGVVDHDGAATTRLAVHVDALAELARVDDAEVFWDSAAAYAPSPVLAGELPVLAVGPVTGAGGSWATPGWRTARSGTDPWAVAPFAAPSGSLGVGAAGELLIGGLEWLGARVYDPTTRGFLSVDPLDPVPGAGWAGNPYSYAGNDPLHALDPTGLRPVTDAELKAYAEAHQGAIHAATQWLENNWEYVAAAAMVGAGILLIASGAGGPLGMALISAGVDTGVQKFTTGHVDWRQVAISGAMGAAGAGAAGYAAKASLQGGRLLAFNAGSNAIIGAVGDGGKYVVSNQGSLTIRGLAGSMAGGALTGAGTGASNQLGGMASRQLSGVRATVSKQVTAGLIEGTSGMAGSTTSQYLGTGQVDGGDVLRAGGATAAGGRLAAAAIHHAGDAHAPYQAQHAAGPQHRLPTLMDYEYGAAGGDVPTGAVANAAFSPGNDEKPR